MSAVIERRALGALAFVDGASGASVRTPLTIVSNALSFVRNPSSLWVIRGARGLEPHETAFEAPPAAPPVESLSFTVTISDPGGRYLPRTLSIRLPRGTAAAGDAGSVLTPLQVALFAAATVDIAPGAAVLRARVVTAAGAPVRNALVRALPALDGAAPIFAFSDADGEAVVIVSAPPPFIPSADAAAGLTRDFAVAVDVMIDPEIARSDGAFLPVDPDRAIARIGDAGSGVTTTAAPAVRLAADRTSRTTITVALP